MTEGIRPNVVGRSVERVDVRMKVAGTARYVDDLTLPGMVHVAVVTSDRPHAELRAVNWDGVKNAEGVLAVFTHQDIPGVNQIGCVLEDQPFLAIDKVRFVGDRIALVAANTAQQARHAASLAEIDYVELPGVFEATQSMNESSPSIHSGGNLVSHLKVRHGGGKGAIENSAVVVEGRFRVNYQEHAYLEPQGVMAAPSGDGLHIQGSMQAPFYVLSSVSRVLGMPHHRIRVEQTVTGGAFGGKEDYPSEVAACAALVAWHLGRPAKLVYTRPEDMQISTKRHRMSMRYRVGASSDGALNALDVTLHVDAGGYAGLSTVVAERANTTAGGPYRFPNAHVDTWVVYTNNLFGGAYRGFGNPQVTFAIETMMDRLAEALKMDPVELRRKNLLTVGDLSITGQPIPPSAPSKEILDRLLELSGYRTIRQEAEEFNRGSRWKRRGVGLALSMYGCCLHAGGQRYEGSGALVQVRGDGTVEVSIGGTELGQGAFTMAAQIASEVLGAPYKSVRVLPTDTSRVQDSGPTVASRTTVMSGNAVRAAATRLRIRFLAVAADILGTSANEIQIAEGVYRSEGGDLPFEELCAEASHRNVDLGASGWYAPPPKPFDKETGQGTAYSVYAFTGHVAEVEVDAMSGLTKVRRLFAAHDVGKAINPAMLEAQAQGGMVQGMGWALTEDLKVHEGRCLNPGFSDYLIPGALDTPLMEVVFVEDPYPDGPYGAKGVGEPTLISVPTAVALAVGHACERQAEALPVTAETVLRWLYDRKEDSGQ